MTLAEIQEQIALDVDNSSSAPSATDTEYIRRRKIINRYERLFFTRRNHIWNLLLKEAEVPTVAQQSYVAVPADCAEGRLNLSNDGYIKIGNNWYRFINRHEVDNKYDGEKICYITGNNPDGFVLNISPTPDSVETVYLRYYSNYFAVDAAGDGKAVMTETTDETKCPSPFYIIFSTIAEIFKVDDENATGLDYERRAEEEMKDALANENQGSYQQGFSIKSESELNGYPGIGRWT